MSWQGNELFAMVVEGQDCDERQWEENLGALLDIYDAHGRGWYLVGSTEAWLGEEDCDLFNPTSWHGSAPSCYCWIPNPFMHPGVLAIRVRNARDLLQVAFEGWDNGAEVFAYAGDGDEPLEHMVVRGREYDMRSVA